MNRKKFYSGVLVSSAFVMLTACGGSEVKPAIEEAKVKAKEVITPEKVEKVKEKVVEAVQKIKSEPKSVAKIEAVKKDLDKPVAKVEAVKSDVAQSVEKAETVKAEVKPAAVKKVNASTAKLGARNPTKNRVASEKEIGRASCRERV